MRIKISAAVQSSSSAESRWQLGSATFARCLFVVRPLPRSPATHAPLPADRFPNPTHQRVLATCVASPNVLSASLTLTTRRQPCNNFCASNMFGTPRTLGNFRPVACPNSKSIAPIKKTPEGIRVFSFGRSTQSTSSTSLPTKSPSPCTAMHLLPACDIGIGL